MSGQEGEAELGAGLRAEFSLQSGTVFLNHGSYGAVPRPVQATAAAGNRWELRVSTIKHCGGFGVAARL